MRIFFVTKDGEPRDGYLTTVERKAVEFMFTNSCTGCRSARCMYRMDKMDNGVYAFLRCSGMNRGYVDYLKITA